jgi:hypothetical protein
VVREGWLHRYSHSVVNSPRKAGIDAGFPLVVTIDTMKNTIINIAIETGYVNQPTDQASHMLFVSG